MAEPFFSLSPLLFAFACSGNAVWQEEKGELVRRDGEEGTHAHMLLRERRNIFIMIKSTGYSFSSYCSLLE